MWRAKKLFVKHMRLQMLSLHSIFYRGRRQHSTLYILHRRTNNRLKKWRPRIWGEEELAQDWKWFFLCSSHPQINMEQILMMIIIIIILLHFWCGWKWQKHLLLLLHGHFKSHHRNRVVCCEPEYNWGKEEPSRKSCQIWTSSKITPGPLPIWLECNSGRHHLPEVDDFNAQQHVKAQIQLTPSCFVLKLNLFDVTLLMQQNSHTVGCSKWMVDGW